MMKKILIQAVFDASIWLSIWLVFTGNDQYAKNYITFLSIVFTIITILLVLGSTEGYRKHVVEKGEKTKIEENKYMDAYQKFSTYIEAASFAIIGSFYMSGLWIVFLIVNASAKNNMMKANKEIEENQK